MSTVVIISSLAKHSIQNIHLIVKPCYLAKSRMVFVNTRLFFCPLPIDRCFMLFHHDYESPLPFSLFVHKPVIRVTNWCHHCSTFCEPVDSQVNSPHFRMCVKLEAWVLAHVLRRSVTERETLFQTEIDGSGAFSCFAEHPQNLINYF